MADEQPDVDALLKAVADAKAALAQAEAEALEELIAAKEAHREHGTEESKERKAVAVARIQAIRTAVRADRGQHAGLHGVGGDAYLSPEQNDHESEA